MLNYIMQYLFILLPLSTHVAHDAGEINGGHSPVHARNMALLVILILCLGDWLRLFAVPQITIFQYAVYALAIHFAFFNYLLNFFRVPRMALFHLGKGPWDRFFMWMHPLGMMALQLLVLAAGVWYYHFYH